MSSLIGSSPDLRESVITEISFNHSDLWQVVPKQLLASYEPRREKTEFLPMRKQRCRSASR